MEVYKLVKLRALKTFKKSLFLNISAFEDKTLKIEQGI